MCIKKSLLFAFSNYMHWGLQLFWRAASWLERRVRHPTTSAKEKKMSWPSYSSRRRELSVGKRRLFQNQNVQLGWKAWRCISQNGKCRKALKQFLWFLYYFMVILKIFWNSLLYRVGIFPSSSGQNEPVSSLLWQSLMMFTVWQSHASVLYSIALHMTCISSANL